MVIEGKGDFIDVDGRLQKLFAIGILNEIISSKKLFPKNYMIGSFLNDNFGIKISKSALNSRTNICARIMKHINSISDKDELIEILNTLYNIVNNLKNGKDIYENDIYSFIRRIKL